MSLPDLAELTRAAQRAADLFVAFQRDLEERRVAPDVSRETLRERLTQTLSDAGVGLDAALDDFESTILPHSMTTPHPRYLGLVNSSPLPGAVLADLLVSMLNNNGGAYHQSPAITTAEEEVRRAFADVLGLDSRWRGMLVPAGTFANLQGLALARAKAFPQWRQRGIAGVDATPAVYAARVSHFSVARSAQVLGIGENHVVPVPTMGRDQLDPKALDELLTRDREAGVRPVAVVATAGTTGTGALDPLERILDVCRAHDVWFHVDACYGGAAALLDDLRPRFDPLNDADSVSVDPHKWFFIPIGAGLLFTRHHDIEKAAFGLQTSYIPHEDDDAFLRGIPTSRRSSGLTIWLALRAHGWNVIRDAVRADIDHSRYLEHLLQERGFRILPDGELSIACARWEPGDRDPETVDRLQREIAESVSASGAAWFATVQHGGEMWMRCNSVNWHGRREHMEDVAAAIAATAQRLAPRPL